VLVHDMSFVERRSEETRRYLFYFFIALGACIALITVVIAELSWRGWVQGLRALLRGEGILRPARSSTAPELRPIARDPARPHPGPRAPISAPRRQPAHLGPAGAAGDAPQRIARQRRHRRFQPRAVYPRAHAGGIRIQHPCERPRHRARARDARMLGNLDRARQRQRRSRNRRSPRPRGGAARAAAVSGPPHLAHAREERGYYGGFANEGLWPLCHIAHVRPTFRTGDFEYYRTVNARFADAVVAEATTKDPSFWSRTIISRCCRE
jgi:trehalose 6-phosphate synthase